MGLELRWDVTFAFMTLHLLHACTVPLCVLGLLLVGSSEPCTAGEGRFARDVGHDDGLKVVGGEHV